MSEIEQFYLQILFFNIIRDKNMDKDMDKKLKVNIRKKISDISQ